MKLCLKASDVLSVIVFTSKDESLDFEEIRENFDMLI